MAGFKDFVDLTILTESDLDDYLAKQAIMKFATRAAADAALTASFKREGMVAYQDDTNCVLVSRDATAGNWSTVGPIHGAFQTWTPIVVQSATPTISNNGCFYMRIGRLIWGRFLVTATSAGTASNVVTVSLPVTASTADANTQVGMGHISDASAGFEYTTCLCLTSSTTLKYRIVATGSAAAQYLGTSSFTAALASGDVLGGTFMYEAAADA